MTLVSLFATWRLHRLNPLVDGRALLTLAQLRIDTMPPVLTRERETHDILGTLERRMVTRFSGSRPRSFRSIIPVVPLTGRSRSRETTRQCNSRNAHHGRRHARDRPFADSRLALRRPAPLDRRWLRAWLEAAHRRRHRVGPCPARWRLARATTDL